MRREVSSAPDASPASRRSCSQGRLVQDLLEPQLVDLVDDHEQQLVVLAGARCLRGQQVVQTQVAAVGQRAFDPRPAPVSWDHHRR